MGAWVSCRMKVVENVSCSRPRLPEDPSGEVGYRTGHIERAGKILVGSRPGKSACDIFKIRSASHGQPQAKKYRVMLNNVLTPLYQPAR